MKGWKDLVSEAKQEVALLQVGEVHAMLEKKAEFLLIDVREQDEYRQGHIPEGVSIPRGILEGTVERKISDRTQKIVLHCAGGGRSAVAAQSLKKMGYENVASMEGGFGAWVRAGYPLGDV
jgi:rhodanese-related sulfurtransferase